MQNAWAAWVAGRQNDQASAQQNGWAALRPDSNDMTGARQGGFDKCLYNPCPKHPVPPCPKPPIPPCPKPPIPPCPKPPVPPCPKPPEHPCPKPPDNPCPPPHKNHCPKPRPCPKPPEPPCPKPPECPLLRSDPCKRHHRYPSQWD
jgi:hypothetical protein